MNIFSLYRERTTLVVFSVVLTLISISFESDIMWSVTCTFSAMCVVLAVIYPLTEKEHSRVIDYTLENVHNIYKDHVEVIESFNKHMGDGS